MDKILEALKKLLPADQLKEVASAVEEILNESKTELEAEFNDKLEEAYKELSGVLAEAEKTGYEGYQEAAVIIADLRGRFEAQNEEFEHELEKGYQEAYEMIEAEKSKNSSIEVDIYDEYDNKLNEMKEYIVEKVDQFMHFKGPEIYEQAKRDVLNNPRMAEHKVALDKIVEVAADYLSHEDLTFATSTKLEQARKQLEDMQGQVKLMEQRSIKMDRECRQMNEALRKEKAKNEQILTENKQTEKKERAVKVKTATGRGHIVETDEQVVIAEAKRNSVDDVENDDTLLDKLGLSRETANLLAGTKKQQ